MQLRYKLYAGIKFKGRLMKLRYDSYFFTYVLFLTVGFLVVVLFL